MFTSFDDDDRADYQANYDGYLMLWAFDTTQV